MIENVRGPKLIVIITCLCLWSTYVLTKTTQNFARNRYSAVEELLHFFEKNTLGLKCFVFIPSRKKHFVAI